MKFNYRFLDTTNHCSGTLDDVLTSCLNDKRYMKVVDSLSSCNKLEVSNWSSYERFKLKLKLLFANGRFDYGCQVDTFTDIAYFDIDLVTIEGMIPWEGLVINKANMLKIRKHLERSPYVNRIFTSPSGGLAVYVNYCSDINFTEDVDERDRYMASLFKFNYAVIYSYIYKSLCTPLIPKYKNSYCLDTSVASPYRGNFVHPVDIYINPNMTKIDTTVKSLKDIDMTLLENHIEPMLAFERKRLGKRIKGVLDLIKEPLKFSELLNPDVYDRLVRY